MMASTPSLFAQASNLDEGFRVPPLSCFTTLTAKFDLTAAVSDLSGVTYNPSTGTIFTVNNGDRMIYEIDPTSFEEINNWNVSDLTLDLESISAMEGRTFVITDENPESVIQVVLEEDGSVSQSETLFAGLEAAGYTAAGSNLGFEGVTYLSNGDGVVEYVMVQEQSPVKLWKLEAASATGRSNTSSAWTIQNITGDLKESSPLSIWSVGGLTRGGDAVDEVFLVVKSYMGPGRNGTEEYIQKGIFRFDLTSGEVVERFGGEVCNMGQPEGLTFWKNETSNTIVMLVVGETYEARIYQADMNCTDALGDINDNIEMSRCEEPAQTIAACEKTLEDGGCGWLRCDKDITDHTKICVDDEPGVTDCSEAECFQHCNTSNFGEDPLMAGKTCTHWAYDVAEKECYIFAGCNNEKFDLDYTLYAIQDPTCERTVEDYPLGCEQRRCNKDVSNHNKICTDDVPGTTDCSLDECKAKCETHTNFTCTTYSYDAAEKECYIFETCEDEQFDEDYSTYVLVDQTCDKNHDEGGCDQRRCDKDVTPHEKICVDDSPETQCSLEECELHCAEKIFEDIGSEAFCTHWAYDAVDKECYIFYGCIAEKYDDDYVLFTQSYGERISLAPGEGVDGEGGSGNETGLTSDETLEEDDEPEPTGATCAVTEENEDEFCMKYIDRLPSNITCDCYDFCNGVLAGCLNFGEEPAEEYPDCNFPRFGCTNDQGTPGLGVSAAFSLSAGHWTLLTMALFLGLW